MRERLVLHYFMILYSFPNLHYLYYPQLIYAVENSATDGDMLTILMLLQIPFMVRIRCLRYKDHIHTSSDQ